MLITPYDNYFKCKVAGRVSSGNRDANFQVANKSGCQI